jgi:tight adherence protein B
MDLSFGIFAVVAFLAVVLALEGLYNMWASKRSGQARRINERLAALRGELLAEVRIERAEQVDRMPWFQALLDRLGFGARLTRFVRSSGTGLMPAELILLSAGLAVFGLMLPGLLGKPAILGLALGLALAAIPWWRVSSRRSKRVARFEQQFPEALDLMGRAMRAGHALPTAVKMVGDELSEPLGRDFRLLFDEMNYGVPTNEALVRLADRVPLSDVSYFVVAVMIQRESGGNLAELLDKISAIVRERLKLQGEIRTLSAEGRLSAIILTALPFGVGIMVNLVNPEFMSLLWTDPLGHRMVGTALFMMVLGMLWMRRIIRIRV